MAIPFVRWTDDLDTFLRQVEDWSEVHELVETLLLDVGLRLNPGKTQVIERGPQAEGHLFDASRDSVFGEDDPVAAADDRFEAELWLSDFGFDGDAPAPAVRTWLRLAGRGPSMKAFEFLQAKPHWLDQEPRVVGDYLVRVCQAPSTRSQVDLDWLLERAVGRKPTQQTAAGQVHACRALAAYRVGKEKGKALNHFAWEQAEGGQFMALGAWSVQAWAQGQGWKPKMATDLIHTLDHHSYRRAAVAGFKRRMSRGDALKHLEPIRRRHPELGPTVAYATSK